MKNRYYYMALFTIFLIAVLIYTPIISAITLNSYIYSNYWGDNIPIALATEGFLIYPFLDSIISKFTNNLSQIIVYNFSITFYWIISFIAFYILTFSILELHPSRSKDRNNKVIIFISFFTSLVILISPLRTKYLMEWYVYANWVWLAFYIYSLIRLIFDFKNIKYMFLAAISSGLLLVEASFLIILIALITIIFLAFYIITNWTFAKYKLTKYISIFLLLLFLFALPAIQAQSHILKLNNDSNEISSFQKAKRPPGDRWAYSAKPWHYIIPDINHPILGNYATKIHYKIWNIDVFYLTEAFFPKENTLYLGIGLMILSGYSIYLVFFKSWPKTNETNVITNRKLKTTTLFLLLILIFSFISSMPPYFSAFGFKLYFPSSFVYNFIPQIRAYARFGTLVVIINCLLASIGLYQIFLSKASNTALKYCLIFLIVFTILFEFLSYNQQTRIYTNLPPQYQILDALQENNYHLEVPRRRDSTDLIYNKLGINMSLNPYIGTPQNVEEIESTLWAEGFAQPESLWCKDFQDLGGKYIMFHKKDLIIKEIVQDFIDTGKVTPELKVAMAESWGFPVWGTHAERPEKDLFREKRLSEMEELLRNDPKFTVVAEFSQEEIATSRPNKNMSSDKLDEVVIFEINQEYCDSLNSTE